MRTLCVLLTLAGAQAAAPPKPLTPIEASTHQFQCLGRKVQLGEFLLPKQIVAAGQGLLSSPIRLVAEPAIFDRLKTKSRLVRNDGTSAEWVCSGESQDCRLLVKLTADCDGFCWYEMTLTPKRPLKVGALRLEIPRMKATARYLHTAEYDWSNVSGGLPEMGGKWSGQFVP
ncbi:MAG TPA: glycoside hydrolase domain-containing protein, partial [Candidatus Dormibacteraeota bacterium]|nr:glycoside hydrolase domain-containing protein [Candidatus Dormibacteraeota bacterium]